MNFCVSCGREIPEGDHICKVCQNIQYEERNIISKDEVPMGCSCIAFIVVTVFVLVVLGLLVFAVGKIWS